MKRGRNQRRRQGGSNPNRALDSNGPDVRIRGTANQIYDKYSALARDAHSAGDRVKAESYQQHAEHYFRVIRANQPAPQQNVDTADGDQPALPEGADNSGDERQHNERPNSDRSGGGRNNRRREEPRAEPKPPAEASNDEEPAPAESKDAEEVEEKPKRRRARRPAKAAAGDADDGKKEASEDTPAAAAE